MRSRYLAAALVLALVASPMATLAQTQDPDPVVTEIQAGDADVNRAGQGAQVSLVFTDADGDARVDTNPDETVYVSLERTQRASFGDIRLTSFLTYPSGTAVNYTNRDLDFRTRTVDGWFARDSGGNWYVDANADGSVSAGDLQLNPGEGVEKIGQGDPETGTSLGRVQSDVTPSQRVIYFDEGPSGLDWSDPIVLDLDQNDQGNVGELRFQASRLSIDDNPTGRQFQAAIDQVETNTEELENDLESRDQQTNSRIDRLEAQLSATEADLAQAKSTLDTRDKWLLALGLADLAAVGGVAYWVYRNQEAETE